MKPMCHFQDEAEWRSEHVGEVGGVEELGGIPGSDDRTPGNGGLAVAVGRGTTCHVLVQTTRFQAARGLQEVPTGVGQDVAAGESAADGGDDRGDVDGGECGVDVQMHPGRHGRTGGRQR